MKKLVKLPMKIGDILAIALSLLVWGASAVYSSEYAVTPTMAEIKTSEGTFLYPLDKDMEMPFHGPQGNCLVQITDGFLRVIDSDCPDKICQQLSPLEKAGDWTACLPNRVMITLTGSSVGEEKEIDSFVY